MKKLFGISILILGLISVSLTQAQTDALSKKQGLVGSNYVLQPLDVISMRVFQHPDLAQEARVSGEGTITLPLIGKVRVAGMTLQDATRMITDLYNRDYLVNPQVTLLLTSYTERRAYVHGQVNKPGPVVIPPEETMTLTQVISAAGSQTRLASDKIQVTRTDSNGRKRVITVYFDDILEDPDAKDIVIEDGDSIYVFERII